MAKKLQEPGPGELLVERGSGYGGTPFVVGQTTIGRWDRRRAPDFTTPQMRDEGEVWRAGVVVPLEVAREFHDEDGLSFGVGADRGSLYMARVRPATVEEVDVFRAAREEGARERTRLRRRRELDRRVSDLFDSSSSHLPDSQRQDAPHPDAAEVPWDGVAKDDDGARLHVHEGLGLVWMSWPAAGKWVDAGCYSHPLTPERQAIVAELRAEYS